MRSQCSANICSLEVVERRRSMRVEVGGDSGSRGVRAITCAPLDARDWRRVIPTEVNPP